MNYSSVADLAASLAAGETVFIAGCAGEPVELTQLLQSEPSLATGVRFIASFVAGINTRNIVAAETRRLRVFFMQPEYRAARAQNRVEFSPLSYYGVQQYLAHPDTALDAAIVQVSEPDEHGAYSLGPSAEFMPTVLQRARRVLGIVNPRIPRLAGAMQIPRSRFAMLARSEVPLPTYDAGASNEATERIVSFLLPLIPSGATLQVGLGKVPNQLMPALASRRDLRLHSGMLSDSMLPLLDAGALDPQAPIVAGVIVGSEALYQRLPAISRLEVHGVEHTHAPAVLAATPRLHAINSAIEVDLAGAVNAEMLNGKHVSGPGGLPDFAHAASRQADGLSIIALNAIDASGKHSRIVAQFAAGTATSVPQHSVDVVVTEFGAAMLRGQDLDERRRRMAAIAHPDHRDALLAAAQQMRG